MPNDLVIAIDPGHGGGNTGLMHNGLVEKHMTRVTAQAMKEELEKFQGVTAVITAPDEETDVSLKERAENAINAGADVLISLHFNMSEEHSMFGSEVWIPCNGLNNADMHSMADIFLEQFGDIGLTLRGAKTRLNDRGTDYYGIIRESVARDLPALLVEHCYADHMQDANYIAQEDNWKAFGRMDAQAVAKYYHLTSIDGQTDYSGFVKNGYFAPESAQGPDKTGPEAVSVEWLGAYEGTAEESLALQGRTAEDEFLTADGRVRTIDVQSYHIQGNEPETSIVYYEYSYDGGETWMGLMPFAPGETQMDIQIPGVMPGDKIQVRLYNGYTVSGKSNTIVYKDPPPMEEIGADRDIESLEAAKTSSLANFETLEKYYRYSTIWSSVGLGLTACCLIGLIATIIDSSRRGKKQKGSWRLKLLWISAGLFLLVGSLAPGPYLQSAVSEAKNTYENSVTAMKDAEETNRQHDELRQKQEKEAKELIVVSTGEVEGEYVPKQLPEMTTIYDIAKGYLSVPLLSEVEKNPYDLSAFSGSDLSMKYSGGNGSIIGIDVSKFQGDINWEAVASAGVKFVIIRLGSRGYGSGELVMDDKFIENIEGASACGIKTGVYFFSTAMNEKEAKEEADFVLDAIAGYRIDMPVVFDTEIITYDKARNANMTPNQLTAATQAFCDRIANAGYKPMIYANAKRFTTVLHLEQLEKYDKWLADYRQAPDYPYSFKMWQFTEKGAVPGIEGNVDINLYFGE